MSSIVSQEEAEKALNENLEEANRIVSDPDQLSSLLVQVQEKLAGVPVLGTIVTDLPDMIMMVKSYITKEYPNVSAKVIVTVISAFIYLIKRDDIINDRIPLIGLLDDAAVLAIALNFIKPELDAYKAWSAEKTK